MSLKTRILIATLIFSLLLFTVSARGRRWPRQGNQKKGSSPIPDPDKRWHSFRGGTKKNKTWSIPTPKPPNNKNTSYNGDPNDLIAQEFLAVHNSIRAKVGEPPLKWDKELALYAHRWATNRLQDCKMIHSYGPYGENLFWGGRDHWTPTEVVQSWVSESKNYDAKVNRCTQGQMCGHYTQVVWRNTLRVGCARLKCNNGGLFVICNYDPPGNFVDENPFGGANKAT